MATTAAQVAVLSQSPGEQPDGKDWWSMAAKRTKAMPQHSLFGTSLEQYDRENLMHTEGRFIPEGYIKPVPNRYPLPDYIKKSIPGRDALESSRRDLQQQHTLLAKTDKQLKAKAQQALTFNELGPCSNTSKSQSSRPSWFKDSDLKHSNEINIVGLNPRGSYNRDKYGPKPRRHNYSLIGDVMAKSMDFNTPMVADNEHLVEAYKKGQRNSWGPGRHLPHDLMEQSVSKNKKPSQSLVNLPSNIRHMFGSRVCDTLLSDKQLVDVALERQRALSGPARPSRRECVDSLPVDLEGNYESLGQATRYNVCPGLSTGHTISRTKLDFNTEVHQKRVPSTDEYRYQRDELSTWSEHNVLRERMKKAWNEAYPLGGKKQ